MAQPYVGEIRMFAGNFAPAGWAFCEGQQLPISENETLFQLIGTTYGGDGESTFALPNLRGQVPIHEGDGHTLGERAGSSAVTITQQTMPQHIHGLQASTSTGDTSFPSSPSGNVLAATNSPIYSGPNSLTTLSPASVTNVGGSQAHNNMMPYLVLNFCIALQGIFPSQN